MYQLVTSAAIMGLQPEPCQRRQHNTAGEQGCRQTIALVRDEFNATVAIHVNPLDTLMPCGNIKQFPRAEKEPEQAREQAPMKGDCRAQDD